MNYRYLQPGEIVEAGDEFQYEPGKWTPVNYTIGDPVFIWNCHVFRRPTTPIPILFKRERESLWSRIAGVVRRIFCRR